jgi:hypothetical protein
MERSRRLRHRRHLHTNRISYVSSRPRPHRSPRPRRSIKSARSKPRADRTPRGALSHVPRFAHLSGGVVTRPSVVRRTDTSSGTVTQRVIRDRRPTAAQVARPPVSQPRRANLKIVGYFATVELREALDQYFQARRTLPKIISGQTAPPTISRVDAPGPWTKDAWTILITRAARRCQPP